MIWTWNSEEGNVTGNISVDLEGGHCDPEADRRIIHLIYSLLHNDELHDLYSSPSIIRMIKSRGVRLEEHVARM
jgi:hypothetical protein